MLGIIFLLAAATARDFETDVQAAQRAGQANPREILFAISIGVGLGVILFLWVYLRFRKKRLIEERNRSRSLVSKPVETVEVDPETGQLVRRKRKRRRKREHRPRNPTLDKTGGLPPHRPEDDLPKY
jgi:hypothetical protein